ncbi:methyltransferase [Mycoplasmoides pneumoniae]|uniref:methyltransferase n=1 Tax=Mycoplasmoides pneumoniae TaxID=2104 RepID=UPI00132FA5AD|nr:methyltransferase [Mycoplasmoides pneumoniae]
MNLYELFLNQKLLYGTDPHFNGVFLTLLEKFGLHFKDLTALWKHAKTITDFDEQGIVNALKAYFVDQLPLPYITGSVKLGSLTFKTQPGVFIPRADSLALLKVVKAQNLKTAVDLCCGSGTLAIALKKRFPHLNVYGSDLNPQALQLAAQNARLNMVEVQWIEADFLAALAQVNTPIDLIITNPPYLNESQLDQTLNQEPRNSLVADGNGILFYQKLYNFLLGNRQVKQVILECSPTQKKEFLALFSIFKTSEIYTSHKQFIGLSIDNTKLPVLKIAQTKQIKALLDKGMTAIIPTDTQIGLMSYCQQDLDHIKQRDPNKHYVQFLAPSQINQLPKQLQKLAKLFWPGAYTFIVDGQSYRLPNSPQLLKLLKTVGLIYCTSANQAKQKPFGKLSAYQNDPYWVQQNCFIVQNSFKSNNEPSLIYNLDTKQIVRGSSTQLQRFQALLAKHKLRH